MEINITDTVGTYPYGYGPNSFWRNGGFYPQDSRISPDVATIPQETMDKI